MRNWKDLFSLSFRHHISGVALVDLLSLIEIHMVSDNIFKASIKFIRKSFMKARGVITLHYFCNGCLSYVGIESVARSVCKNGSKNNSYFVVIPLFENLQSLFSCESYYLFTNFSRLFCSQTFCLLLLIAFLYHIFFNYCEKFDCFGLFL